jgi:hypothetical protein
MVLDDVEVIVSDPAASASSEQASRKRGVADVHIHDIAEEEAVRGLLC